MRKFPQSVIIPQKRGRRKLVDKALALRKPHYKPTPKADSLWTNHVMNHKNLAFTIDSNSTISFISWVFWMLHYIGLYGRSALITQSSDILKTFNGFRKRVNVVLFTYSKQPHVAYHHATFFLSQGKVINL